MFSKIYKCKVSKFMTKNGSYHQNFEMYHMRTLSCKGCEYCNYDNEELKEYIDNDCEPIINEMVDQALYKLTYVNIKHDYETGYVDNYDIEFEIIK